MTIDQVEARVLRLPRSVRARPAELSLASPDAESESELAWADEAERRYPRYVAGDEEAIPAAQAMVETRADLEC